VCVHVCVCLCVVACMHMCVSVHYWFLQFDDLDLFHRCLFTNTCLFARIFTLQALHTHSLSLTRCTHKTGTSSAKRSEKKTCERDIKRGTRSEKRPFHHIDRSFSFYIFVVPAPRILESTCVTAETAVEGVRACLYVCVCEACGGGDWLREVNEMAGETGRETGGLKEGELRVELAAKREISRSQRRGAESGECKGDLSNSCAAWRTALTRNVCVLTPSDIYMRLYLYVHVNMCICICSCRICVPRGAPP